jgi:hypothetical protein
MATPPQTGTLENIALALARLLQPLEERLASGNIRALFAEMGLQFPPALDGVTAINSAAQATVSAIKSLPSLITGLIAAIEAENFGDIVSKSVQLIDVVRRIIESFDALATQIRNAGAATGVPAGDVTAFANELPERLLEYLIVHNLDLIPGLGDGLEFIGVIGRIPGNVGSVDPNKPPYVRLELNIDALVEFIQSPVDRLKTLYGWGNPGFDGVALLTTLQGILNRAGFPAVLDTGVNPPVLDVYFVELRPRTDLNPRGLSLKIADKFMFNQSVPFTAGDATIEAGIDGELKVGTEVIFQPDDRVTIIPPSGEFRGDAFFKITLGKSNGEPYIIVGQAGGSRLEIKQFMARVGAGIAWAGTQGEGDFSLSGDLKGGKILITMENADGFLGTILGGLRIESDFDMGLGFTTKDGLYFTGSSTLEIQLPLHVALGPVEIDALTISVGLSSAGFPIGLAVDIKAMLGPLQAVVEQIGLEANITLPPNQDGNLGPVDFALGFKPPKGAGLSLDVGVVKGGGYLFFDPDKGEYAGALELTFAEFLSVKAIGIITTKMPDGSPGFSLLIIITAEFGAGIQLGFGFTLLGMGGLLGLNRTMNLEALMLGVRTGSLESIMFPQDVVANAPRIISDLQAIFPPENGKFLIGPMVKIGWGTPTLISLAMGIIIEIPGNIAIVGILKLALPADDVALIVLQVNFAGAIEFDKKRMYFFASLFESRVLFMTIEGEMGLLIAVGDDANFVLSVGGFHPRFNPPPLPFPNPIRIAVNIINTDYARIRVSGYFAVTSNSVQFGAKAELYFGFSAFNIQGHIGFDVLIQFSPFLFIAEISASVSFKAFGVGLFSIRLRFSLEGPSGWRAMGEGSLSLLFFEISADFDISWGEEEDTKLPEISVIPLLKAELEKPESWRALLPTSGNLLVALRELDSTSETDDLVLHPVGTLEINQKLLPLDLDVVKLGNQKIADAKRFTVNVSAGGLGKVGDAEQPFAIAQYQDMDDATKLSRPAFQTQHSGVKLSVAGQQFRSSRAVKRIIRYEEIIIDNNYLRFVRRFKTFAFSLFNHFLHGSAITQSTLSSAYKKQLKPQAEAIKVKEAGYSVAFVQNNKAAATTKTFASEAQARDAMQQMIAVDPNAIETLHVIPEYEVMP